jgi:hypothetical protein
MMRGCNFESGFRRSVIARLSNERIPREVAGAFGGLVLPPLNVSMFFPVPPEPKHMSTLFVLCVFNGESSDLPIPPQYVASLNYISPGD